LIIIVLPKKTAADFFRFILSPCIRLICGCGAAAVLLN